MADINGEFIGAAIAGGLAVFAGVFEVGKRFGKRLQKNKAKGVIELPLENGDPSKVNWKALAEWSERMLQREPVTQAQMQDSLRPIEQTLDSVKKTVDGLPCIKSYSCPEAEEETDVVAAG